jgi:hypothetical protein
MSYNVFRVAYVGASQDHYTIFVDMNLDDPGTGLLYLKSKAGNSSLTIFNAILGLTLKDGFGFESYETYWKYVLV